MSQAKIVFVWTFASNSGPGKNYETLLYADGTKSCNCPGWTRRAERSCKHTRLVDQGIDVATRVSIAHHDYRTESPGVSVEMAQKPVAQTGTQRKLRL